ncbi:hypothetical protein RR48_02404 [Papilio machaon]|uniref:Uncharacterized protein n=1 Tax=Papilio machaon TaxID=76193 RepID=A0A0N0PES7_PAPMA|nr:hypothetical protein RR48_02404 [Papilio machaon]
MPLPPAPPYRWMPSPPSQPLRTSPVTLGKGSTLYPVALGPYLYFATSPFRPTRMDGAHPRDEDATDRNYFSGE